MHLSSFILTSHQGYFIAADATDSNFIFFVLSSLISVSLISLFYSKASPVHKVLALLLLSVLTVFLWAYETQFLFVYLVYILAFVGAVLILFLSVVLMLPISTTSNVVGFLTFQIITLARDYDVVSLRPLTPVDSSFHLSISTLQEHWLVVIVLLLIFINIYSTLFLVFTNLGTVSDDKFQSWLEQFVFVLVSRCSGSDLSRFFSDGDFSKNPLLRFWGQHSIDNDTPFRFVDRESILRWTPSIIPPFVANLYNHLVVIMTLLYGFLRYPVYLVAKELTLRVLKLVLRYNVKIIFTRQFTECLVSIYLLFNLFALAFPSTIFTAPATEGLESVSFGLSELRSLLYNDFGWFLLLSTLVLLVALFGVAIITRNKK